MNNINELIKQNKILDAVNYIYSILKRDPFNAEIHFKLGKIYLKYIKNYSMAAIEFQKALKISKGEKIEYYLWLIYCFNLKGFYDKVKECIEKFKEKYIEILPEGKIEIDRTYNSIEEFIDEMLNIANKNIIRNSEKYLKKRIHEGKKYLEIERNCKAIIEFKKVLDIDPDNLEAHFGLGIAYTNRREFLKALGNFKMVIKIKRDHYEANSYLLRLYMTLGMIPEARVALSSFRELYPDDKTVLNYSQQIEKL